MANQNAPEQSGLPAFKLDTKVIHYLSARNFEAGTEAVYGNAIEIIDTPNDTTHEFSDAGEEPVLWSQEKLAQAIKHGHIESAYLGIVLYDLINRGALPAGDYFIRVSW